MFDMTFCKKKYASFFKGTLGSVANWRSMRLHTHQNKGDIDWGNDTQIGIGGFRDWLVGRFFFRNFGVSLTVNLY